MTTTELLENLHQTNDQRLEKVNELITKIDKEMTLMIKVISHCAQGPHRLVLSTIMGEVCLPTCSACIAQRYLSNSLNESDLKLLKGEK